MPSLPRDMARIVKRCLAKDPSRRYQTAIDVRNELDELSQALDSGEAIAEPARSAHTPASRRVLPWIAIAVAGLIAGVWMFGGAADTAVPTLTNARQITSASGVEDFPTWSPDGQTVAYESAQSGSIDIWVAQIGGGAPVNRTPDNDWVDSNHMSSTDLWVVATEDGSRGPLVEGEGAQLMSEWSPDGNHILYTTVLSYRDEIAEVWRVSSTGEDAERLAASGGWTARWSPDGSSIYFLRDQNIWTISADGKDERQLTNLVGKRTDHFGVGLATDGRFLYFSWGEDIGDIWVMDVVTDDEQ